MSADGRGRAPDEYGRLSCHGSTTIRADVPPCRRRKNRGPVRRSLRRIARSHRSAGAVSRNPGAMERSIDD